MVSRRPRDRRRNHAVRSPTKRLGGLDNPSQGIAVGLRISDDTTFADTVTTDFKLGLDQQKSLGAMGTEQPFDRRHHQTQ